MIHTIDLTVTVEFLDHRAEKFEQYNQRGRSDKKFLMDLDAELLEFEMLRSKVWKPHDSWKVDAIDLQDRKIDVKFIPEYYNMNAQKMVNLIQQRDILDGYKFYEWTTRRDRPFAGGDRVTVRSVGYLPYAKVADNVRVSFRNKIPGSFYVNVRKLLES